MLAAPIVATQPAPFLEEAARMLLLVAGAGDELEPNAAAALAAIVASDARRAAARAHASDEGPEGFRARALKRVDRALAQRARALVDGGAPFAEHFAVEAACLAAGAVAHARAQARPVDAVAVALAARDL